MPNAQFSIQATLINPANFFVGTIRDASNPNVILQTQNPPPPYGAAFQLLFPNLIAKKSYIFDLWESPNTTATGVLINSFAFVPSAAPVAVTKDAMVLQADTAIGLISGTSGYVDPNNALVGWTYTVQLNGVGSLIWGQDIGLTANNNWAYINGKLIDDLEVYTILFNAQINQAPNAPVTSIVTALLIDQSMALTNNHINTDLLVQALGQNIIIALPDIGTVGDFEQVSFLSAGGNHINASIRCFGSDVISKATSNTTVKTVTKIVLGQNEQLILYKYTPTTGASYWVVRHLTPTADMVGQIIKSYEKNEINGVFSDGSLKNRLVYERLYDKALANNKIVSDINWTYGKYSNGTDPTNFRIPDFTKYGFLMGVSGNGGIDAGDYVPQNVGKHDHVTHGQGMITRNGGTIRGFISRLAGMLTNSYSAGGPDQFGASEAPDRGMRTDFNTVTESPILYNTKNMVDNTACYISIRC